MLAGPVRWILDSPALLVSPEVVQLFPAISLVSEAEVAVSVSQAGRSQLIEARLDYVSQL